MAKRNYPVQTTATSFRVIEALHEMEGARVTELADRLDLSKSAVHKHLQTLVALGYVSKERFTYRIGLRFLGLGSHARSGRALYGVGRTKVEDLAYSTGETASLFVEDDGAGVCLFRSFDQHTVDEKPRAGDPVPLNACAPGKAILAHLPRERVVAIVEEHGLPEATPNTITSERALFDELRSVRDRGLAFDRQEQSEAKRGVAAPVTNVEGRPLGAVSVSGPTERMSGKRLEEDVAGLVLSTANSLEIALS